MDISLRSPWLDLLSLHGYIIDDRRMQQQFHLAHASLGNEACNERRERPPPHRLCLGIGDGSLRMQ
jgi:hypothetical protein